MNELIEEISKDLCMMPFKNENSRGFGNRIIYSALVAWAKVQLLGKSYTEINSKEYEYPCVSQQYIICNLRPVVKGLLQSIPYESAWLIKEIEEEELTEYIIKKLVFTYEINKLLDGKMTVAPKRMVYFKENELLLGGIEWNCNSQKAQAIGLGVWREKQFDLEENYSEIFNIPVQNINAYYQAIRKHAIWEQHDPQEEWNLYEAFIPGQGGWHSKAWNSVQKHKNGITLIRKKDENKMMLINYEAGCYYTAKLDPWYKEEREIYRIQYMLNAHAGRPTTFSAKRYEDHVILHCHTPLPNAESRIMLLGSWPYEKYNDMYRRVIPINLWDDIKGMLVNLGIEITFEE